METDLELVPLLTMSLTLDPPVYLGKGPFGRRCLVNIPRGSVNFETTGVLNGTQGTVLSGAADYVVFSDDLKTAALNVTLAIHLTQPETAYVLLQNHSVLELSKETTDELRLGGTVSFDRSNFIGQPRFEVGDLEDAEALARPPTRAFMEALMRLNRAAIVSHGKLGINTIDYRMYVVANRFAPVSF